MACREALVCSFSSANWSLSSLAAYSMQVTGSDGQSDVVSERFASAVRAEVQVPVFNR